MGGDLFRFRINQLASAEWAEPAAADKTGHRPSHNTLTGPPRLFNWATGARVLLTTQPPRPLGLTRVASILGGFGVTSAAQNFDTLR